jgi:hypothetical protein
MTLWWIGNIVFIAVIIPVVVLILGQVLAPAKQIGIYADDICKHGAQFGPHLEALEELGTTRELVRKISPELERYVRALDQIH